MDMRHRDRESAKRGTKESVRSGEKFGNGPKEGPGVLGV